MGEDGRVVFGGVDTHRDTHVAAVVDNAGRVLGTAPFGADPVGYEQMTRWFGTHGHLLRVGVEGTGSYGAGLARYLMAAGIEVVEVNRPNRQLRRQRGGKTDSVDAEAAARAAASGKLPQFPNLVTARLSAYGCCWWPAARLPRPAPRPLTRSILWPLPHLNR